MAREETLERQQFLSFTVAGDTLAVPILRVHEILQYEVLTPVPGTPAFIRGVLNRRGSVLPVIDLAVKVGRPASTLSKWSCVVIVDVPLEEGTLLLGLLVDTVDEVLDFGPEDLTPPPAFGTPVRLDYLRGMGRREQRFVLLLDIDRVLSARELELSEAAATPEALPPEEVLPSQVPPPTDAAAAAAATAAGAPEE